MDSFDMMNTPVGAPAGASGDGNNHSSGGATHQSAEEEVQFLRRKIKYLQSVSTVFRQKVALILRDVKRDPAGRFNDFERNYNAAVTEITQAELTEFGYDGTPLPAGGLAGPPLGNNNNRGTTGGDTFGNIPGSPFAAEVLRYQRARASRDDIKKTHHLCTILQEKNEIKAREVSLRKKCDSLQQNYDELEERFTKFVELQASGAGPQAAQQEIWEKREQSLQKEIVTLKTDIARLKTGEPQTIVYEDAVIGDTTLAKQNQMLKARLQRAKEEVAQAQKRGSESASDLQGSLDSLIEQIHSLRSQLSDRDNNIAVMTKQRNELAKELVTTRSQLELHSARAASLEKQQEDRLKAKNEDGTVAVRGAGGENANNGVVAGESIYGRDLDVAQKRIRTLEQEVEHLTEKVALEMNLNREKEIKMESLGNQIQHLRKRIDTQAAGKEQREGQRNTLNELEGRLFTALQDMQSSQLTVTMTQQMGTITEKLKQLEHVELQLRQKEDELTIAQDSAKGAKNQMEQMKRALQSISTMYMKFPQSAAQLERMIIELEEHKAEMQRCASDRDIPDMVRLSGVIDLRCMDAQGSKPLNTGLAAPAHPASSKVLADHSAALSSGGGEAGGTHFHDPESILLETTTGAPGAEVTGTATSAAVDPDTVALDDSDLLTGGDPYDRELFQELPPPPALISSASALTGGGSPAAAAHRSVSATPGQENATATGMSAAGGTAGSSGIADGDARLTFQLFDEKGEGRLPVDTIRLCLTTLGLPTRLIPPHTKNMSMTEFVALCSTAN